MWRPSIKTNWPISTLTKGSNLVLIVAIIITIHSPQHQHHSQKYILDLIDEECPSKAPQTQGVKYQTQILIEPQRRLVLKLMQITDTASSQIVEPAKDPPSGQVHRNYTEASCNPTANPKHLEEHGKLRPLLLQPQWIVETCVRPMAWFVVVFWEQVLSIFSETTRRLCLTGKKHVIGEYRLRH